MQFLDLFGLRRDRRIAAIEAAVCRNLGDFRPKGSGNYRVLLGRNAYRVESSSPAELAEFLKTDTEIWEAVIKTTGIRIE